MKAYSELIQASSIESQLETSIANRLDKIIVLPSVASTNDYLADLISSHPEKTLVCISNEQTKGKGRYGHSWHSPANANLYLSLSYPVRQFDDRYETLGLQLLLAMAEMLGAIGVKEVKLKWPNDIFVEQKKLGGILIEKLTHQAHAVLVIGIGLNISMSKQDNHDIATPWTDLVSVLPAFEMSRETLAAKVIASILAAVDKIDQNESVDLANHWQRYDELRNKKIEYLFNNKRCSGIVKGINNNGQLGVERDGKIDYLHDAFITDITL